MERRTLGNSAGKRAQLYRCPLGEPGKRLRVHSELLGVILELIWPAG